MDCPLCETSLEGLNSRFYYECRNCKAYVKDDSYYLSKAEEKAFYELHNNDVHDEGYKQFTSPIWKYVIEHFSQSSSGLDFGSGTGPIISKVLQENKYNVNLYDPFFAPDEQVLMEGHYDYIFSCEVFEHLHQPKKIIEHLIRLLKPNGSLLIMTLMFPKDKPFTSWYYINDPTHVFIYTKETFEFIAQEFNLKIKKITPRFIVLQK